MSKGRRYEHDVSNDIYELTDGEVFAWPAGYSGNNAVPSPDVITLAEGRGGGWELKKTAQETFGIDESELQQLLVLQRNYFDVGLVVKFTNREPLVVKPQFPSLTAFGLDDVDPIENFIKAIPDCFEPRRAEGGKEESLRLSKPSLDNWESAQCGLSAPEKIANSHGVSV